MKQFIYMLKIFVVGTPRKRRRTVDEEAVQIPLAKGYSVHVTICFVNCFFFLKIAPILIDN